MRLYLLILLVALLPACGVIAPVKQPTPKGLTIVYDDPNDGRYRLPEAKVREIDERHAAVLECIPPEEMCRNDPPQVQIRGGACDTFVSRGRRIRGEYIWNQRAVVPGSLGALGHEMTHHYACEQDGSKDKPYKDKWLRRCGDEIDKWFREMYPPNMCPADKKKKP